MRKYLIPVSKIVKLKCNLEIFNIYYFVCFHKRWSICLKKKIKAVTDLSPFKTLFVLGFSSSHAFIFLKNINLLASKAAEYSSAFPNALIISGNVRKFGAIFPSMFWPTYIFITTLLAWSHIKMFQMIPKVFFFTN